MNEQNQNTKRLTIEYDKNEHRDGLPADRVILNINSTEHLLKETKRLKSDKMSFIITDLNTNFRTICEYIKPTLRDA